MVTDIYSLEHEPFSFDGRGGGGNTLRLSANY